MAVASKTLNYDNLNTTTTSDFDRTLADNIGKNNELLKRLLAKKKNYPGGVDITEPVLYALGDGGAFEGWQVLTPTEVEVATVARFLPAAYQVNVAISLTDESKNRGPAKILDLFEAKYEAAKLKMDNLLTTALYAAGATGPQTINGLPDCVATSAGSSGGISSSTYAWWDNQRDTTTTLSDPDLVPKMQALWQKCTFGNIHPDIIATTDAVYNRLWEIADSKGTISNPVKVADLGYTGITFNRVPVIADKDCTANFLYMLNTDYLFFKVDSQQDMKPTQFLQGTGQQGKVKYINWIGNLVCNDRRYQGVMNSLS